MITMPQLPVSTGGLCRYRHTARNLIAILLASILSACVLASEKIYDLHYTVELRPEDDRAQVLIEIDQSKLLRQVVFNIDPRIHSDIKGNGNLVITNDQVVWSPPAQNARLSLNVKISHKREGGEYDALITKDWALFRGDDLIPSVKIKGRKGARSRATLDIKVPQGWTSSDSGWPRTGNFHFLIDNPERRFDRPTGWMIAGKLGIRREQVGNTEIAVGAPAGSGIPRMEVMSFLNFVWPDIERAFGKTPPKLLIVMAGKPMWRGGLSGPNSLFLHADRPLVSENGTSSLIHELTHVVSRIRAAKNDDWIAEGLAEFYSFELLYRAGGITKNRRDKIIQWLAGWGENVGSLRKRRSTAQTTARAVVLLDELDREIRSRSKNRHSIDDVTQQLMVLREVSVTDLRKICKKLIGSEAKTLQTPLLD